MRERIAGIDGDGFLRERDGFVEAIVARCLQTCLPVTERTVRVDGAESLDGRLDAGQPELLVRDGHAQPGLLDAVRPRLRQLVERGLGRGDVLFVEPALGQRLEHERMIRGDADRGVERLFRGFAVVVGKRARQADERGDPSGIGR